MKDMEQSDALRHRTYRAGLTSVQRDAPRLTAAHGRCSVCSRLLDDSFDGIIIKELLHYGDNRRNDVIRPTNGALSLNQWKAARYLAKVLKKTTLEVTDVHAQLVELDSRNPRRRRRSVIKPTKRYWPNGIMPYEFDPELEQKTKDAILAAMRHIEDKTCIQFRPRTPKDKDYVVYVNLYGCWSPIGRQGGEQFISIGDGCEHLGFVAHETSHALGFWHEQSRHDRDKYITIVTENIEPNALDQFAKRPANESVSLGFAYDYLSITHYEPMSYSVNAEPTIKVNKIARENGFKIGQREKLSDLDIAQLRAIYNCNIKDAQTRACEHGWVWYKDHCYKFEATRREEFDSASAYCRSLQGWLVDIADDAEDRFLASHLSQNYANITIWRTAGRKVGDIFRWELGGKMRLRPMDYTAWPPGQPGFNTSLVLAKRVNSSSAAQFIWQGQVDNSDTKKYAYPPICKKLRLERCFRSNYSDGRDYRGKVSYSQDGITCQTWSDQYPHKHSTMTGDPTIDKANGLARHNYCRNPGGRRARPWCYVLLANVTWQYCDVTVCL